MKRLFIPYTLILLYALPAGAQDMARRYISEVNEEAVLFSGKVQSPYPAITMLSGLPAGYSYHPYLVSPDYSAGDIRFNHTLYKDVRMRYDLLRDEMVVCPEGHFAGIVLEKEKVKEVWLHGVHIVPHSAEYRDIPYGNYLLLLHDGLYPVLRKHKVMSREEIRDHKVRVVYSVRQQFFVRIGNVCRPITGKGSVLKLFPRHRAALNAYAKEQKLNFRTQREQSILSLITYAETIR
jgi:hypothetical protein